ncbi:mediator of RNA polymerase II transcription subunit 12-like protein [Paramacrobiotus metropolitanus]|uniref:mediator of RNA polymerase II transcription subunit 12-like protein n=1 Tax=Paramacrobiotus metropolitanus TaxID=2943436 RepID=UPI002445A269|nr:mediator of RNA polymerase II transcription subunit 12-like protein [Paramacrobiotus metropolitanus]
MSAFASPDVQRRQLKKPRLGAPDVYPQELKQKEDELSARTLKEGFSYPVTSSTDEYGSARPGANYSTSALTASNVNAYFNGLLTKKEEFNTIQDSAKKRSVFNSKEICTFFPVAKPTSKSLVDAWFKELNVSRPPLTPAKKVPVFNKKEDVISTFYEYDTAFVKAAWYIKLMAGYAASQPDSKVKKRQILDPGMEWTQAVLKTLKDLLPKLSDYYRITGSDKNDGASILPIGLPGSTQLGEHQDYETLFKQWKYCSGLAHYLYQQGLLDRHDVCTWLVDTTEKVRTLNDGGLLKLLLPCVLHFMIDILQNEILSRKLVATCSKYLASIAVPVRVTYPQKTPLQLLDDALECGHHLVPVRATISIIQMVVMKCPNACIWNFLGEEPTAHVLDGSPLDLLPVFPSELPIGQCLEHLVPNMRETLRLYEDEIRTRSTLIDTRWANSKVSTDSNMAHISSTLAALEALDRYPFHKSDGKDNMDALYNNVFGSILQSVSVTAGGQWKSEVEPLIFLLCRWSVGTQRSGIHRGLVVAFLLEKFQAHLIEQLQRNDDKQDVAVTAAVPAFLFQNCLMRFLDEEGPKFDNVGQPVDSVAFDSLVLLFAELIARGVFSHDTYVCALISTGIIPQAGSGRRPIPPVNPAAMALESPMSQEPGYMPQMSPCSTSVSTPASVGDYYMQQSVGNPQHQMMDDYQKRISVPQSPLSVGFERKPNYGPYSVPSVPVVYPSSTMHGFQHHHMEESGSVPPMSADVSSLDGYAQPASVSSVISEPAVTTLSPHYYYVLHFPIPSATDMEGTHETNQRLALLYGFGRARDQPRHQVKKIRKDIQKLFHRKGCYDAMDGKMDPRPPKADIAGIISGLRQALKSLSYFDRNIVSTAAMGPLLETLHNFSQDQSQYVPAVESIIFVMQMMEAAFNIRQLLTCVTKVLGELTVFVRNPDPTKQQKTTLLYPILVPPVVLFCVGLLRKYHCCLLLSQDHTGAIFEGLKAIVNNVLLPGYCTSAERCVLAYMYDLYQSCAFLQAKYQTDFNAPSSKIRSAILVRTRPSSNKPDLDKEAPREREMREGAIRDFVNGIGNSLLRLRSPSQGEITKMLNDSVTGLANMHFFVVSTILRVTQEENPDTVNELANTCAEMTANCNGSERLLTAEWLAAFQAFIFTYNRTPNYDDLLRQIRITDEAFERIAIFCGVLVARHCLRLEDFIGSVAIMTLMSASKCQDGDPTHNLERNLERSGRLAAHIMLRLLQGSYGPPEEPGQPLPLFYLKYPCDRYLLVAARRNLSVAPLLAVLKAMLVLSDSDMTKDSRRNRIRKERPSDARADITRPFGADIRNLNEFVEMVLCEICQEDTTRECVMRELENLFSPDLLLDSILTLSQTRHLVRLICYPVSYSAPSPDERPTDDKQAFQRMLRALDQWNLRVSWMELRLMLKLFDPKMFDSGAGDRSAMLDIFVKALIDVFQLKTEANGQPKKSKNQSIKYELDSGEHVWFLAPIVAKLSSVLPEGTGIPAKVLNQMISVMESCTWPGKKEREKLTKSTLLLGYAPFLSLLTTCLNKAADRNPREQLLQSLYNQLTQFAKEDRLLPNDDNKLRSLILDSLMLRLSLLGSLFDIIQKNTALLVEWAFLLAQLIISGCVDPVNSQDTFYTVLDMFMVLIHTALAADIPGPDRIEERKTYITLVKKVKKEIGEKLIAGVEHIRLLLPLSKKSLDVIAVEPAGCVFDAKGNKITTGFDVDKKPGLRVSYKVKLNPWEVLEGFRNPFPMSWSFFRAIRTERKLLSSELQYRVAIWHTHPSPRPLEYYLESPHVPVEEDMPAPEKMVVDEPANSETTSIDTSSPRSPRARQSKAKKSSTTTKKRQKTAAAPLMGVHSGAGYGNMGVSNAGPMYNESGMMMAPGMSVPSNAGQPAQQWYGPGPSQGGMAMAGHGRFPYPHQQPAGSHPAGPGMVQGMSGQMGANFAAQEAAARRQGTVRQPTQVAIQQLLHQRREQSQPQPQQGMSFLNQQLHGRPGMAMPPGANSGQPMNAGSMSAGMGGTMNAPGGQMAGSHGQMGFVNRPGGAPTPALNVQGGGNMMSEEAVFRQQQVAQSRLQQQQQQLRMAQMAQAQAQAQAQQNQMQAGQNPGDVGQMVQRPGMPNNAGYGGYENVNMQSHEQQPMQTMYMDSQQNISSQHVGNTNQYQNVMDPHHSQSGMSGFRQGNVGMNHMQNMGNVPPEYLQQYQQQQRNMR